MFLPRKGDAVSVVALKEPVSILMPVCNEVDIIEEVMDEWINQVLAKLPAGSELILDDCSTDGTERILQNLAERHPFIRINFAPRDGFFNSAMRLYRLARCPLIFFTDSDGQYVPEEFWKIAAEIERYDMVHGYKLVRKDEAYRVQASAVYNVIVKLFFRSKAIDVNSAFRLIRRPMLEVVLDQLRHLRILPNSEMYIRAEWLGYRIKNVPVMHRARKNGISRALPIGKFIVECLRALRGLNALSRELRSGSSYGSKAFKGDDGQQTARN